MKLTKKNTITVAILTESGASFNEEGVDYVKDMITEVHPEMKSYPVVALMGDLVKYPKDLAALAETNEHLFVAVSYEEGEQIKLFYTKKNPGFIPMLWNVSALNPDITSWKLFTKKETAYADV